MVYGDRLEDYGYSQDAITNIFKEIGDIFINEIDETRVFNGNITPGFTIFLWIDNNIRSNIVKSYFNYNNVDEMCDGLALILDDYKTAKSIHTYNTENQIENNTLDRFIKSASDIILIHYRWLILILFIVNKIRNYKGEDKIRYMLIDNIIRQYHEHQQNS